MRALSGEQQDLGRLGLSGSSGAEDLGGSGRTHFPGRAHRALGGEPSGKAGLQSARAKDAALKPRHPQRLSSAGAGL